MIFYAARALRGQSAAPPGRMLLWAARLCQPPPRMRIPTCRQSTPPATTPGRTRVARVYRRTEKPLGVMLEGSWACVPFRVPRRRGRGGTVAHGGVTLAVDGGTHHDCDADQSPSPRCAQGPRRNVTVEACPAAPTTPTSSVGAAHHRRAQRPGRRAAPARRGRTGRHRRPGARRRRSDGRRSRPRRGHWWLPAAAVWVDAEAGTQPDHPRPAGLATGRDRVAAITAGLSDRLGWEAVLEFDRGREPGPGARRERPRAPDRARRACRPRGPDRRHAGRRHREMGRRGHLGAGAPPGGVRPRCRRDASVHELKQMSERLGRDGLAIATVDLATPLLARSGIFRYLRPTGGCDAVGRRWDARPMNCHSWRRR